MKKITVQAKAYIGFVVVIGLLVFAAALVQMGSADPTRFLCYFALSILATGLKVTLPVIQGTLSLNFLFVLIAMLELSPVEALVIGTVSTLVQCLWRNPRKPSVLHVLFNVANMATAVSIASSVYEWGFFSFNPSSPVRLVAAAVTFFLFNTFPVAAAISLTERKPLRYVWKECYFWSLPYYIVGAAVAGFYSSATRMMGWHVALLVLPVIYLIYRSYRLYVARMEDNRRHTEEMEALHHRTIEALALAIEAKDMATHDHLQRVQIYAVAIGRELGLTDPQLDALRAAAVLHDIGKLAVPEHIVAKPGRLTPEEFEKMKIHPVVGAEILERVQFPYDVAPLVRYHHERWDGSGYPEGLKGTQIPVGARILAVVDCLDALATDRQYRRALPLDDAMAFVKQEAGRSYDPQVVEILGRRYKELEARAQATHVATKKLRAVTVERGLAPAAGFENTEGPAEAPAPGEPAPFLASIASAREEASTLYDLVLTLGNSLRLDDTLSVLAQRLKRVVHYDAIAIYIKERGILVPRYVNGENFRLFNSLRIPMGEGLSGWVAEHAKPIVNGNPSVEPGYLKDPKKFSTLRSALAIPLEGTSGLIGVLTLYHLDRDAFTGDHLRILLAVSSKVSHSVENAMKYEQAQTTATTDYITDLPNARSLFVHLEGEIERCRRLDAPVSVLLCDLDGFKQVNDSFGHLHGNQVLRTVAARIRSTCRAYDYVARLGGDEFVLVLPGMPEVAVSAKRLQLEQLILEAGLETCGRRILSLSIGEARFPEDGQDAEQLIAVADRRMYETKEKRRAFAGSVLPIPGPAPVVLPDRAPSFAAETTLASVGD